MPLRDLYNMVAAGDSYVTYYSEVCDTDPARRGIALSKCAEAMLASIAQFEHPAVSRVLNPEVWAALRSEMNVAKPFLEILHFGRVSAKRTGSLRYQPAQREREVTQEQVDEAGRWFHTFLTEDNAFRSMLALFAGGGTHYSASVQERVLRSATIHGYITDVDIFLGDCRARAGLSQPEARADDTLFLSQRFQE